MAIRIPSLSKDEAEALRAYWEFYEPLAASISTELRETAAQLPEWAAVIRSMTQKQIEDNDKRSRELQRAALVEGVWEPYLTDLQTQGVQYARMGVSFHAWFDLIGLYRIVIRRHVFALAESDFPRARVVSDGLNKFVDIAMSGIGEAYLAAKEQIIRQQQEAIRELSLPVLQVRERLLIVPLVGMIDSTRARQLTETLLVAIRDRRAKGVVMDVTGVPMVDSAVANHLVQACDAARLMGAHVIITGIASEIAQTLVAMGARLPEVHTVIDLQEGLVEMERILGYAFPVEQYRAHQNELETDERNRDRGEQ